MTNADVGSVHRDDAASASASGAAASSSSSTSSATVAATKLRKGGTGNSNTLDDRLSALLSSPSFTVPSYLNLALSTAAEDVNKDEDEDEILQQKMAELALQLQLQTQSCHDEIGRIGAELQAILPRCGADVGRLGVGLHGIQIDAEALLMSAGSAGVVGSIGGGEEKGEPGDERVKDKGGASKPSPATPLETLSTLHALRTHLRSTRSILSAASSWDETLSRLPSLLSSTPPNLTEAVTSLSRLEDGYRALRGMPGREDRADAISRTRGQIEVLLKPQLLHALQKMDTRLGPLQQCVGMYRSLGKMDSLKMEYVRLRPSDVHRRWFEYGPGGGAGGGITGTDGEGGGGEEDATDKAMENDVASAFLSWLPTWYEAVLALLSEERRRSSAVFGVDMAPDIICRVLGECFRPILPSFKTRLATIHSHHTDADDEDGQPAALSASSSPGVDGPSSSTTSAASTTGSLESICALYESTLQFLSLAYEQMAGFDTATTTGGGSDAASGATTSSSSGANVDASAAEASAPSSGAPTTVELENLIRSTFVRIASPFAPYQRNFAGLEWKHSSDSARMVARDVQNAVVAVTGGSGTGAGGAAATTLLTSLQDAMERLEGLGPFMFPLAEASVARFELLNCGYRAPAALSTIDSLLSNHIGELAIAIGTLSATLTSDVDSIADAFDEQHVQCALEVLKVAGSLRRDLRTFESKTRDRLRALGSRMAASVAHEREVQDAGKGRGFFVLPDSLSAVEVEAMLAKAACGDDDDVNGGVGGGKAGPPATPPSLEVLQHLAAATETDKSGEAGTGTSAVPLFPDSIDATVRLAHSCHVFVFDVCYAVPRRYLRSMSSLPVWREGGEGDDEVGAESYGILPQSYVTHVGEHMLALVQALEPFASNVTALSLANEVMEGVRNVSLQAWKEFAAATGDGDATAEDVVSALLNGKKLTELVALDIHGDDANADEEDDDEEELDEAEKASAAFCNEWLDAVGSAVTARLLERTLRIQHLSRRGCEHLAADVHYLINVFSALGVAGHPHPLLRHVGRLVTMEGEELRETIVARRRRSGSDDGVVGAIRAAEVRVALMRGIAVS